MSRTSTIILLGVLIILMPFSGLPISIRTLFTVIFGASVLGIGLALRAHEVRTAQSPAHTPVAEQQPQTISPI